MLVLIRRLGESIIIDNDITVTVLGVQGHQVRLGITAPEEVEIYREEIYKKIQEGLLNSSVVHGLD